MSEPVNDNEQERSVTLITGRVRRRKGGKAEGVHVMLVAPDDDSAVRTALEALARKGYAEAEFSELLEGESGVSFLPKPLDIKTLAERVKQELHAG